MSLPWKKDHGLSRAQLATLLRERVGAERVEWLSQGWDCDVFRVTVDGGDVQLIKYPRRADVVAPLRKEARLLVELHRALPGVAPRLIAELEPEGAPGDYAFAMTLAEGEALFHRLDDTDLSEFTPSFVETLQQIHGLDLEALGPRPERLPFRLDGWCDHASPAIPIARRRLGDALARRVAERLDQLRGVDAEISRPVFTHDDLFPEHIFLAHGASRVCTIIDWADASWHSPVVDLAMPGIFFGDAYLEPALERYASNPGARDALRCRAHQVAALVCCCDVKAAEDDAPNLSMEVRLEALVRMSREGWLTSPLSPRKT